VVGEVGGREGSEGGVEDCVS
jgi:hypothetical protein